MNRIRVSMLPAGVLVMLLASMAVTGCGQKGDLYREVPAPPGNAGSSTAGESAVESADESADEQDARDPSFRPR